MFVLQIVQAINIIKFPTAMPAQSVLHHVLLVWIQAQPQIVYPV